jgi:hypothetical protein
MKKVAQQGDFKVEVPTQRHIQLELKAFDNLLPILFKRFIRSPHRRVAEVAKARRSRVSAPF